MLDKGTFRIRRLRIGVLLSLGTWAVFGFGILLVLANLPFPLLDAVWLSAFCTLASAYLFLSRVVKEDFRRSLGNVLLLSLFSFSGVLAQPTGTIDSNPGWLWLMLLAIFLGMFFFAFYLRGFYSRGL